MAIFKKAKLDAPAALAPQHTVLLVDDEPDNLSVLSAILGSRYRILKANDGQEALEMVQAMAHPEELTVVVSDQRMPRLTGVQLCERLCEISPDTVRIIVTGHIDNDAIVDSINRARIHQFVRKPFDREDFELTVQRSVADFEKKLKLADYVLNLESRLAQHALEMPQQQGAVQSPPCTTDALTGLGNRSHLLTVIEKDVAIVQRGYLNSAPGSTPTQKPASDKDLLFYLIDCDHFKQFNEQYGRDVGDELLCAISKVLLQVFRASDHVLRWDGGQFLVVARFAARSRAAELAERTRASLAEIELMLADGSGVKCSCSIGYAALPFLTGTPNGLDWQQVLNLAEYALRCAKQSGRNTWVGLSAGAHADGKESVQHQRDIPAQLARGLLRVESPQSPDHLRWV